MSKTTIADLSKVTRIIGPYQWSGPKGDPFHPASPDLVRYEYEIEKRDAGWEIMKATLPQGNFDQKTTAPLDGVNYRYLSDAVVQMENHAFRLKEGNPLARLGRIFDGRAVCQEDKNTGDPKVAYLPTIKRTLQAEKLYPPMH